MRRERRHAHEEAEHRREVEVERWRERHSLDIDLHPRRQTHSPPPSSQVTLKLDPQCPSTYDSLLKGILTGLGRRSTASNVGGLIRPTVFEFFQIFFAEYLGWLTTKRIALGILGFARVCKGY